LEVHHARELFSSTKVGCGKATSASGSDYIVCNYDPAGNYWGVQPFPPPAAGWRRP
jgi:hypothetical protein